MHLHVSSSLTTAAPPQVLPARLITAYVHAIQPDDYGFFHTGLQYHLS